MRRLIGFVLAAIVAAACATTTIHLSSPTTTAGDCDTQRKTLLDKITALERDLLAIRGGKGGGS